MSKYLKSLIIACLAACMTVCLGIFAAACTNNDDGKLPESVSVTVMLDENTPAVGVKVQLCATGANGLCLEEKFTNNQGVATIAIPEDLGKDYEVHLRNLDEVYDGAYQYVDGNGTPYAKNKGIQIDVTKNSSPKITLKAKSENTTTHTIGLDVATNAVEGHTYTFTATEAGYYKVSVTDNLANLTIDSVETFEGEKVLNLEANASIAISVNAACEITVTKTEAPVEGTQDNPKAITLDTNSTFTVDLAEIEIKWGGLNENGEYPKALRWEVESYYYSITTATAGNYKITVTLGDNDDVAPTVYTEAGSYADQVSLTPSWEGNDLYFAYTLEADTEYLIQLSSTVDDYTNIVAAGTNSLTYTVKIELMPDSGDEGGDEEYDAIVLGTAYDCDAKIYKLVVEATANYTFTISGSDGGLFALAVANSLDNIDWGDITWGTDPNTGNTLSTDTVELEAGTYYVAGYEGNTFTITLAD